MLVYRSETPHLLRGKEHLPVYWKSNKTAWVTQANFGEWFTESFNPEVKNFLSSKNLAFKVWLLLDDCGHLQTLSEVDLDVEVVFSSKHHIFYPAQDQKFIETFESYYLHRVMEKMVQQGNHHRTCEDFNSINVVKSFLEGFNIMDAITFIEESWNKVKNSILNASWRRVYSEIVPKKKIQMPRMWRNGSRYC